MTRVPLRIAVCDDDEFCRQEILSLLNEYTEQHSFQISVSIYANPSDLMEDVFRSGGFDIYLLDIIMPEENGIQLGIRLRQINSGKIIYLTSSTEYAIDSYRAKAFDYILKPPEKEVLFASLDEVIHSITARTEKSLIVKAKGNSVRLNFDHILYVESVNRRNIYHLIDGDAVESNSIRTSFAESVQELLKDSRFVLCGSSHVLNLYYIKAVGSDSLVLKDGNTLYFAKKVCREVRSYWSDFWMSKEGSK